MDTASTAGIAAKFEGGTTTVRLLDSVLDGKVEFGTGTDTFTVRDSRVTGAIDFGTGSDTLSAHGDTWLDGAVSNLETVTKRGTGNLVIGGNATFSSGASAEVENGGLVFTGQFNLGTTGTMRIHDAARLTAALVDADTPPQITAGGGLTFDGDAELFVQVSSDITDANETTYLDAFATSGTGGTNPIANGTTVTGPTGTTRVALRTARGPSTVGEVGHIPLVNGATSTAGTVVTSGVSLGVFAPGAPEDLTDLTVSPEPLEATGTSTAGQGGSGLSFGGGVGALGSALSGLFDDAMFAFALDGGQDGEVLPAAGFLGVHKRDGDVEYWTRSWSDDSPVLAGGAEARVRGADMGAELPAGTSFRLGVSLAPEISISSATSGAGTRLDGTRYAVRGGWRGEHLHAGASVSQGRYRAHSVLNNPVAGGGLSSAFGLVQDHVQVGAGARMTWGGVRVAPSVSLLSGVLRQDAHSAEGAAFRAEVPAFSQRYQGWKGELGVSSAQWLRGRKSLRWRPALHLYSQRTHSTVPGSLDVAQHDRAGVKHLPITSPRAVVQSAARNFTPGFRERRAHDAIPGAPRTTGRPDPDALPTRPPMSGPRYINFDTLSLHAGQQPDPATGARATPIYQTTSYVFRDSDHAAALFNAERPGHVYSRITNPTTAVLEERVAALEGGVGAIATASGQAAMHLAIATIVGAGEHIVASSALYGGSHNLLSYTLPRFGIETTFVDPRDPGAFRDAIRPETRLVFSETLGNPGLDVLDIPAVADIAHAAGLPLLLDSTFTTPYLLRPFDHGADLVFHSATKFLGGHGVAIGGVLVDGGTFDWDASGRFPTLTEPYAGFHDMVFTEEYGPAAFIMRARKEGARDFGACMSPTTAFHILQGVETLSLRMERHVSNTRKVVEYLNGHDAVASVVYPELPEHPDHELAKKLLPRGCGAVFSFELEGGRDAGRTFIESLRVFSHLANVGDAKSLVIHPASTTHHRMDTEALARAGISEGTVRLSIGLEDIDDLLDDLGRALHRSQRAARPGVGARRAAS